MLSTATTANVSQYGCHRFGTLHSSPSARHPNNADKLGVKHMMFEVLQAIAPEKSAPAAAAAEVTDLMDDDAGSENSIFK